MKNNFVTLDELLTLDSFFPFNIIAGRNSFKNKISKIENADNFNLNKNQSENLLLVFENEKIMPFLQELVQSKNPTKISAIFILRGSKPILLPELIVALNQLKLPLIYLPETEDIQTIKTIFEWAIQLKKTDQFTLFAKKQTQGWLKIAAKNGAKGLIQNLTERIGNHFFLMDSLLNPLCPENILLDNIDTDLFLAKLKNSILTSKPQTSEEEFIRIQLSDFSLTVLVYPLISNKKTYSYLLALETNKSFSPIDYIIIQQVLPILLGEGIKHYEITETEKRFQNNFIYDLLHNNISSLNTIIKQGQTWGWDFTKPHQLLLIDFPHDQHKTPLPLLKTPITQVVASQFKNPIIVEHDSQILVMIPTEFNEHLQYNREYIKNLAKEIFATIEKKLSLADINMGIGRLYPTAMDLCRSYQEAKTALELGKLLNFKKKITHFDDLGLIRLLASVSYEQLQDFSLEYLTPLLDFDRDNQTDLLKTLEIFLQESGDFNSTAQLLFVHPNTLRHRIKRIEEILATDLDRYNHLVNLWTAIKIHIMLKDILD